MALPSIDFAKISVPAKDALVAYGSPAMFTEQGASSGRIVKVVVYRDTQSEGMIGDLDSAPATAILNPDDYKAPNRMPRKFDTLKLDIGGFVRTYTIEDVHPIVAADTLPLLLAQLRTG